MFSEVYLDSVYVSVYNVYITLVAEQTNVI